MTTITKLKNALAALEKCLEWHAAADLRSVIAEMEAGEPVAYVDQHEITLVSADFSPPISKIRDSKFDVALFTHPQPKAEPLPRPTPPPGRVFSESQLPFYYRVQQGTPDLGS